MRFIYLRRTPRAKRPSRKEGEEGYDPYDFEEAGEEAGMKQVTKILRCE